MPLNGPFSMDWSTSDFSDPDVVKAIIQHLSNLVEALNAENIKLKADNQKLKDEINRLKGQKGKPDIKPKAPPKKDTSNKKKKGNKKRNKQSKLDKVDIDKTKTIRYEGSLPDDARHKGYRRVVVQDILITTKNIEYQLERFYSPSEGKTYEASLPDSVDGEFGAGLKSWVLFWYFNSRVTENKIHQMLSDIGIRISAGKLSDIIINKHDSFHREREHIISSGIRSSLYQHTDDTGARVQGTNQYFSVLCNDYYSAFFTNPKKDRLTVIDILTRKDEPLYLMNHFAIHFLRERNLNQLVLSAMEPLLHVGTMTKERFEEKLKNLLPDLKSRQKTMILESAAIAAYQENHSGPVIQCLVCDDAKQFFYITPLRALCWIHEERHYQKLTPFLAHHQKLVDDFRARIWDYYNELKKYKENPSFEDRIRLSELFDEIFYTKTGYDGLDNRIELTRKKKDSLLVVLDYPDTPLHNNPAELALRMYVIKRKISFGTKSEQGTKAWETFFTIMDTCRKLGINFREYLLDRISKRYQLPSLASLIPKPL